MDCGGSRLRHLVGVDRPGQKAATLHERGGIADPAGLLRKAFWRDKTGTLRTLTAALTIFFIMFYINSGLIAGAKLLESIFGMGHNPSVLLTLVAVASYTFIGGFMAVSRTDVFQSLVMLVSFIILPLTLIFATDEPFRGIGGSPGFFNPFTDADGNTVSAIFVLSAIGWGLGAFGS